MWSTRISKLISVFRQLEILYIIFYYLTPTAIGAGLNYKQTIVARISTHICMGLEQRMQDLILLLIFIIKHHNQERLTKVVSSRSGLFTLKKQLLNQIFVSNSLVRVTRFPWKHIFSDRSLSSYYFRVHVGLHLPLLHSDTLHIYVLFRTEKTQVPITLLNQIGSA